MTTRRTKGGQTRHAGPPSRADVVAHLARCRRVFQRLPENRLRRLVDYILDEDPSCWRSYAAGDVLFEPGQPALEMFVIMSGAFEERSEAERTSSLLWEIGPGEVVGEIELFAKRTEAPEKDPTRVSSVHCAEDGKALVIRQDVAERLVRSDGDFAVALLNAVATDAFRLLEEERRDQRIMQTYFDGRLARLVPAPYRAEGVEMNVFVARTASGGFESLVPPGVEPCFEAAGLFLLVFANFPKFYQPDRPDARPFEYRETAFFVPARMPEGPEAWRPLLAYAPAVYPDNFMALVLGREIFGFRKRNARTYLPLDDAAAPPGTPRVAQLELDGAKVARVDYALEEASTSAMAALVQGMKLLGLPAVNLLFDLAGDGPLARPIEVPVINLKQIPGPGHRDGAPAYEVNELCLTPFRIRRVHRVDLLSAQNLRLSGRIPFEGARLALGYGLRITLDFDLETGSVVRKYEPHEEPLPDEDTPAARAPAPGPPPAFGGGRLGRAVRGGVRWVFDRVL